MVARMARFEGLNVEQAEKDMDAVGEMVHELVSKLPGFRGELHLWSDAGEMLSITLFESEEQARAAEPMFDQEMPAKLGDYFRSWEGRRTSVGLYQAMTDASQPVARSGG